MKNKSNKNQDTVKAAMVCRIKKLEKEKAAYIAAVEEIQRAMDLIIIAITKKYGTAVENGYRLEFTIPKADSKYSVVTKKHEDRNEYTVDVIELKEQKNEYTAVGESCTATDTAAAEKSITPQIE